MRVNDALARAVHLTTSSQRNNQKYTGYKKLDQRVSDFQKAALLQKCYQINEQENKLDQSGTVDKLLSDASKICGHSTNAASSTAYSSSIHTPYDPLFDFETTTNSTSLSGCASQAKVPLDASTFHGQSQKIDRSIFYISISSNTERVSILKVDIFSLTGVQLEKLTASNRPNRLATMEEWQRHTKWQFNKYE
ncbi:hypothetical protein K450DRAFT_202884 [Umbelopsis ramanniana AG]|uniref:Uncharacterized protein n=1 Tax=Umbelopsis ramanniana AG TaxID=1314678 RepID=A0AAD5E1X8_UMBRA|nr:uncharacterized protein K450DRAFT_202884 [Umbelopsis ramanniana AG]KAI8575422.1 hypothetical protein K450DRAFT_202884 [Umbelopsis ramanniana AG]